MTTQFGSTIKLPADREHSALRIAVLLLIVVGVWLSYRLILLIWGWRSPGSLPDYAFMASCVGGIPLGLAVSWVAEQLLLRFWHSGNYVILDLEQVCVQRRDEEPICLQLGGQTAVSAYYFSLGAYARGGRERRAPRRWLCVAVQLEDEVGRVVVFALLPPGKAAVYTGRDSFHEIQPSKVYGQQRMPRVALPVRPSIPEEVLHGENGRLWLAERYRWESGVELSAPDFETFMSFVETTGDR